MQSADQRDLENTIHVVDQKVDRLAMGVVEDFKKAHDTTQGAFEDLRAYSEFLAERVQKHTTAEIEALRSDLTGQIDSRFNQIDSRFNQIDSRFNQIERRFDRLEERLFRKP